MMEHQAEVFRKQKAECLSKTDLSKKGNIDAPIKELVELINAQSTFFTTSSCSGRIAVVDYGQPGRVQKQGCSWLLMSHGPCTAQQVKKAIAKAEGQACFKFEAFVLHVQCASLEHAQNLLAEAVGSGHRNSGISLSRKGKIVLGVRSTHSLEVPLTHEGHCLVSDQYVEYIVDLANEKMKENTQRITRFQEGFLRMLNNLNTSCQVACKKPKGTKAKLSIQHQKSSNDSQAIQLNSGKDSTIAEELHKDDCNRTEHLSNEPMENSTDLTCGLDAMDSLFGT